MPVKKPRQRQRSNSGAAQMVEFGAAFYVLLFSLFVPLFGLCALALSFAVGQIAVSHAVAIAAESNAYDLALQKASDDVFSITQTGLGRLANLRPRVGNDDFCIDLFIDATDLQTKKTQHIGPNEPLATIPQPNKMLYSYSLISKFETGPFIHGPITQGIDIPYVTTPVVLTFHAERGVEHLDSLNIDLSAPVDMN